MNSSIAENIKEHFTASFKRGLALSYNELVNSLDSSYLNFISSNLQFEHELEKWHNNLTKLNFLTPYLCDPTIREILIHSPTHLQIDQNGHLKSIKLENLNKHDMELSFIYLSNSQQATWNYNSPFASFYIRLNEVPFRATLIHAILTPQRRSKLFLRRLTDQPFSLNLFSKKNCDIPLLIEAVKNKKSLIICGPTGSGKTSLLQGLLQTMPLDEHLVIIEDTHELTLDHPNLTHLISSQELKHNTMLNLCSYALRIRPDRIILGEIRSNEVIPYFMALNTGHQGMISTLHASSAEDAVDRLALLYSTYHPNKNLNLNNIKELIFKNIDQVIFMEKKEIRKILNL